MREIEIETEGWTDVAGINARDLNHKPKEAVRAETAGDRA